MHFYRDFINMKQQKIKMIFGNVKLLDDLLLLDLIK